MGQPGSYTTAPFEHKHQPFKEDYSLGSNNNRRDQTLMRTEIRSALPHSPTCLLTYLYLYYVAVVTESCDAQSLQSNTKVVYLIGVGTKRETHCRLGMDLLSPLRVSRTQRVT